MNARFGCGIALLTLIVCARDTYDPRFVDYLQEEKALRSRVPASYGLADSIALLRKEYDIDVDEELEILSEYPEEWIRLLKEIRREQ
jgi:hypothetical protein